MQLRARLTVPAALVPDQPNQSEVMKLKYIVVSALLSVCLGVHAQTGPARDAEIQPSWMHLKHIQKDQRKLPVKPAGMDDAMFARWGFLALLVGRTFTNDNYIKPTTLTVAWRETNEVLQFTSEMDGKPYGPTSPTFRFDPDRQRVRIEGMPRWAYHQSDGSIFFSTRTISLWTSGYYLVEAVDGFYYTDGPNLWHFKEVSPAGATTAQTAVQASPASASPAAKPNLPVQDEVALVLEKLRVQQAGGSEVPAAAPSASPAMAAAASKAGGEADDNLSGLRTRLRLAIKSCGPDDLRIGGSLPPEKRPEDKVKVYYTATCPGQVLVRGSINRFAGDGMSCFQSDMRPITLPCKPEDASVVVDKVTGSD